MQQKYAIAPMTAPPIGTALPSSPSDGQLFVLTDNVATPTYTFQLRYNAAKSSNKWDVIGGAPVYKAVETDESTNVQTYVDLATVGPAFTTPVAGIWLVHATAHCYPPAAASLFMGISVVSGSVIAETTVTIAQAGWHAMPSVFAETGSIAASTTIKMQYHADPAGTAHWTSRRMTVTPIALGG